MDHSPDHGARRLMVIVPDRLSGLVAKGEVTARYYNPGDVFDEVHLVLVNDDRPDPAKVQPMVGRARHVLHNLPDPRWQLFASTLGWRPFLLRRWARQAVDLAARVQPDLIRCHAAQLNAFAAAEIERRLGVPFVVSLHANPTLDFRCKVVGPASLARRIVYHARERHARLALRRAVAVICVYEFIVPYARKVGARRIELIYNVVGLQPFERKHDYQRSHPAEIIAPGRQHPDKNPEPLLRALAELDDSRCTLVGQGPLHERVKTLVDELGIADRVTLVPSMRNEELVASLHRYDVLVSVNDYGGVSKVELESALVGMPVITNTHPHEDLPEILGENCIVVEGTSDSYRDALRRVLDDDELRAGLGQRLRSSVDQFHGNITEAQCASLYRELLRG
jgi:glycosyltransferase involved in cell wall biosynthesis